MCTLVIHAPQWKENEKDAKSFRQILSSGVGGGYAIADNLRKKLYPGCRVVLLCAARRQRAEGTLQKLVESGSTRSGMKRYDVHIEDFRTLDPYKHERLNRQGVAVIE